MRACHCCKQEIDVKENVERMETCPIHAGMKTIIRVGLDPNCDQKYNLPIGGF